MMQVHDNYFLVAILDNDYIDCHLLDIFEEVLAEEDKEAQRSSRERIKAAASTSADAAPDF